MKNIEKLDARVLLAATHSDNEACSSSGLNAGGVEDIFSHTASQNGSFDIYIQISGIDGDSTDSGHQKWIEASRFNFWIQKPSFGSHSQDRINAKNPYVLDISKNMDAASVKLASAAAGGRSFETMKLDVCLPPQGTSTAKHVLMTYDFTNVIIESLHWSGVSSTSERPQEAVTINFATVTWAYTPISKDGKPGAKIGPEGWDIAQNIKI